MSRQIKMRYLWEGKWYFIDFQKDNLHLKFKEFEERPKPTRLYLWTGLLDKNGKEIYEGDIVSERALGTGRTWASVCIVGFGEFSNDYCEEYCSNIGFYLENAYTLWSDKTKDIDSRKEKQSLGFNIKDTEVIGNIYENPELLEVKNNGI